MKNSIADKNSGSYLPLRPTFCLRLTFLLRTYYRIVIPTVDYKTSRFFHCSKYHMYVDVKQKCNRRQKFQIHTFVSD